MDTEKVCVNLPAAELGKIDVLVAQGLYSSRTDLIRSGIRKTLEENHEAVRTVIMSGARIGYQVLSRAELEMARRSGTKLTIFVMGVLRIRTDVTPDLADATVEQIQIFGSLKGPKAVLDRLGDKIVRGFGT
ncbi:MAG TPA: CopG family transcriptional regulator [Actinomycetota bacterium]|nr:CopG family transcriptional regulator [Actinomycetota bacterium]